MHPQRWGDPAAATSLPETARGLIELAFGIDEQPAVAGATPPAPVIGAAALAALEAVVGADQVLVDDTTRALRTRGKSTPDLLKARAGDLTDAPDVVVRPADQGRDRGAPRRRRRPPARGRALRWRDVGHRWPRRRACGVRRSREPRPGADEAAAGRRQGVDDRHPRARPARPRGRGAARRAGPDAGSLPAVVRVRHDRRLRGHPVERAVERRLRPVRRARGRAHRRHAVGHDHRRLAPRPTPPAPTCARCSSAPRAPSA